MTSSQMTNDFQPQYDRLTQTDVDALWLSARISLDLPGIPRDLRKASQLRIQRLMDRKIITIDNFGDAPKLVDQNHRGDIVSDAVV